MEVENLECCPQLWKVDLSNNKIKGLDGLKRFIALGTLDLSGNLLTWKELQKIRHIQILDLQLYGNPELQNDIHYRVHVPPSAVNHRDTGMYQPYNYRGGNNLYNELYLTLHFLLLEIRQRGSPQYTPMRSVSKWNMHYKQCCNFLASETVLLFAVVPYFYNYIGKNARVNNILYLATGESDFVIKILEILQGKNSQETGVKKVLEQASEFVIQKVHEFHYHKRTQCCKHKWVRQLSFTLQANKIVPNKSVVEFFQTSENLHQGIRNLPDKTENKTSIKCPDEPEVTCRIPGSPVETAITEINQQIQVMRCDTQEACEKFKVKKKLKKYSAAVNSGTKIVPTATSNLTEISGTSKEQKEQAKNKERESIQIKGKSLMSTLERDNLQSAEMGKLSYLSLQCEEKEKIPPNIGTKLMDENEKACSESQANCKSKVMSTVFADCIENSQTSEKQNEEVKNKESFNRPDSVSSYQEECIEAWKSTSPETSEHTVKSTKSEGANDLHEKFIPENQLKRETCRTLSIISLNGFTVASKTSLPFKSDNIYGPQNLQLHRKDRKRNSTLHSLSKQNEVKLTQSLKLF
ncbi:hypothetical protein chiPu_0005546 [Chiloscyllium punctatum]|uniref:Uncharacterized protein n=1 Tax=Chiloscyllium punctatum TaxID=137246 RepID=A0A401S9T4_CHIPU|nr:hypothetical protein [Chiloscyllium punctatum]